MLISLIVPCYNEQEALPIFYEESTKVLAGMDCEYEFLFVNDGSKDATLSILKDLAERDEHVTYLSFSRNFGKEAAMYAGFTNAKGDYDVHPCSFPSVLFCRRCLHFLHAESTTVWRHAG